MEDIEKTVLANSVQYLCFHLADALDISVRLIIETGTLSYLAYDEVRCQPSPEEKTLRLLDILQEKASSRAFYDFIAVLRKTNQSELAEHLEEELKSITASNKVSNAVNEPSAKIPRMLKSTSDSTSAENLTEEKQDLSQSRNEILDLSATQQQFTLIERHTTSFLEFNEYVKNEMKVIRNQEITHENKKPSDLFCAVLNGDFEKITIMLREEVEFELVDVTSASVLHCAVCAKTSENNMLKIVDLLLKKWPNLIYVTTKETKRLALHFACATGYLAVVEALCRPLSDSDWIKCVDELGRIPLFYVSQGPNTEESSKIVALLLKREEKLSFDARLKRMCDGYEQTPLHTAVADGNEFVVRALLEDQLLQEKINHKDIDGLTALFFAYKSQRMWELLTIIHGADISVKNEGGCPPFSPNKNLQ